MTILYQRWEFFMSSRGGTSSHVSSTPFYISVIHRWTGQASSNTSHPFKLILCWKIWWKIRPSFSLVSLSAHSFSLWMGPLSVSRHSWPLTGTRGWNQYQLILKSFKLLQPTTTFPDVLSISFFREERTCVIFSINYKERMGERYSLMRCVDIRVSSRLLLHQKTP